MRRRIALAAVLVALGGGALWLLRGTRGSSGTRETAAGRPDAGPTGTLPRQPDWPSDAGPSGPGVAWGLAGFVEDDVHRPVPGARIKIVPDGPSPVLDREGRSPTPREVEAGRDGAFGVADLAEGRVVVYASHDRFPVGGFAGPFAIPREDSHPVLVVLGSAAAVEGSVKDGAGNGITGATVGTAGVSPVVTGAHGEFHFSALDPRRPIVVHADADGYAPSSQAVRLRAGEVAKVELVLARGRELRGRVLDDARRVVEGAQVLVRSLPDARTETDGRGEFRFVDLPEEDLTLTARHPEYAESVPVSAGPEDRFVELVLRRAASLAGTVFGPGADPLMGVRVSLMPTAGVAEEEREGRGYEAALSNAEGRFRFERLVEGTYSLLARSEGEAGRVDGIVLRRGDERTGVDLHLGGRIVVTGRVVTAFTGEAAVGASVRAHFPPASLVRATDVPQTVTDSQGRFRIGDVPVDVLALRVTHPAHAPETFSISASGHSLDVGDLELDPRQFGGVGMTLRMRRDAVEVRELMEGMPAERAGLVAGDLILAVDGQPVAGLSLEDVVGAIRGAEGETVTILVQRRGRDEPIELSIVREIIDTTRSN